MYVRCYMGMRSIPGSVSVIWCWFGVGCSGFCFAAAVLPSPCEAGLHSLVNKDICAVLISVLLLCYSLNDQIEWTDFKLKVYLGFLGQKVLYKCNCSILVPACVAVWGLIRDLDSGNTVPWSSGRNEGDAVLQSTTFKRQLTWEPRETVAFALGTTMGVSASSLGLYLAPFCFAAYTCPWFWVVMLKTQSVYHLSSCLAEKNRGSVCM